MNKINVFLSNLTVVAVLTGLITFTIISIYNQDWVFTYLNIFALLSLRQYGIYVNNKSYDAKSLSKIQKLREKLEKGGSNNDNN